MAKATKLTPQVHARLERLPGSARRYFDPLTQREFSQRQVQQFRAGLGVSIERASAIRRAGFESIAKQAKARGESINFLARQWSKTQNVSERGAVQDPAFWRAVSHLRAARSGRGVGPKSLKAQALVAFGLRPAGFAKPVGFSPPVSRGASRAA